MILYHTLNGRDWLLGARFLPDSCPRTLGDGRVVSGLLRTGHGFEESDQDGGWMTPIAPVLGEIPTTFPGLLQAWSHAHLNGERRKQLEELLDQVDGRPSYSCKSRLASGKSASGDG